MPNKEQWHRCGINNMPPANVRVLISDGEVIAVARLLSGNDQNIWIFDCESFKDLHIIWWNHLPDLPPVIKN